MILKKVFDATLPNLSHSFRVAQMRPYVTKSIENNNTGYTDSSYMAMDDDLELFVSKGRAGPMFVG